jgi:hypothetical protein
MTAPEVNDTNSIRFGGDRASTANDRKWPESALPGPYLTLEHMRRIACVTSVAQLSGQEGRTNRDAEGRSVRGG